MFTANVAGEVKVWPAKMSLDDENRADSPVPWDPEAYDEFESRFQSLPGVPPGETSASFEVLAEGDNLDQFTLYVSEFVDHCRDAAE